MGGLGGGYFWIGDGGGGGGSVGMYPPTGCQYGCMVGQK